MFVFLVAIFCFGFVNYYAGGCASCRVARARGVSRREARRGKPKRKRRSGVVV